MNFLAHTYLSGEDPDIIVGNFIGDFVKGNKTENYTEGIQIGIRLHRRIDEFTDTHHVAAQSKQRLFQKYRHYAGVIVDMFYDHFLAANWNDYHNRSLITYTEELYSVVQSYSEVLPTRVNYMLRYMIPNNWLYSYSKLEGINRALQGLATRTKFESGMENAIHDLKTHYSNFDQEFKLFFPELISFANDELAKDK